MNHSPSPERLLLDHCAQELAEAHQLEELMALHSRAESIQVWAKSTQQTLEMRNRAAILRLAVERKTGKLLSHMHLRGGDRKSKGQAAPLILKNIGITRDQSKRWQKLAAISDEQFAQYGERATRLGQQTTAAGLHRFAEESGIGADTAGHQPADKLFVPKQPNASIVRESRAQENQAFACDFKEIANHATILWQVLSLENNGQTTGLSEAERRAVIYFLGEPQTLLNKVSGQASNDSQPTT